MLSYGSVMNPDAPYPALVEQAPSEEATPKRTTRMFVHVLLFRCPNCGEPVLAAHSSKNMDREHIAICKFEKTCNCRWSGNLNGLTAVQHWVEPWEQVLGASG